VLAHFERCPPQLAASKWRHARALLGTGRRDAAIAQARAAWDSAGLDARQEADLLAQFGEALREPDHLGRIDKLLWSDQTTAAARMLPRVDTDHRLLALARIALRRNAPDVEARLGVVPAALARDPGLIHDRARWLQARGALADAQAVLITQDLAEGRVTHPERWLALRLELARAAWRGGAVETAVRILASHRVAAPQAMAARPLAERLLYADTEFLAGFLALRRLDRAAAALAHFRNLRSAVTTPVSQARADYWSGRAAAALGDAAAARGHYAAAAAHPDYFYGQLAIEALGQRLTIAAPALPAPDAQTLGTLRAEPRLRAAAALGELGAHGLQTIFLKQLAETAETPARLAALAALAPGLSRPDLGVYAGKAARNVTDITLLRAAFPVLPLPAELGPRFTVIHAVARQESMFDTEARSSANALGLMQLLPATAAEQAGKLGLPADTARLTSDPIYNVTLGSAYFERLRSAFGGSWPLAAAAYNAGPGNARRIIATAGDPRDGRVDVIDWVESVPFAETRTYIQRVLENAVVYDALYPQLAGGRPARLSAYLRP
jgi:soluble lytic murein transglycosylase